MVSVTPISLTTKRSDILTLVSWKYNEITTLFMFEFLSAERKEKVRKSDENQSTRDRKGHENTVLYINVSSLWSLFVNDMRGCPIVVTGAKVVLTL